MTIQEIASLTPPEPPPETACACGQVITQFWLEVPGKWTDDTECDKCRQDREAKEGRAERLANIMALMRESGIPRGFLGAKLEDLAPGYRRLTGSLFLTSPPGRGKSHLAASYVRERLIEQEDNGCAPRFIEVPELLMLIRATYGPGGAARSELDILETYGSASLLVLDDLGVEKVTDWTLQTLSVLINRRYHSQGRTIITSNLSIAELSERLSDRIASRIAGMCQVVKMTGPDRRLERRERTA